jgi:hypothetical protein
MTAPVKSAVSRGAAVPADWASEGVTAINAAITSKIKANNRKLNACPMILLSTTETRLFFSDKAVRLGGCYFNPHQSVSSGVV